MLKSRQVLEILQNHHINLTIIEYLKTPLTLEQLLELRSYFDLRDFVRTNEPVFKKLNFTLDDEDKILEVMLREPILMQRPIVTCNERALIARPPEKVFEIIESNLLIHHSDS